MALVYLDSSIIIYLVERHPVYAPQIESTLSKAENISLVASPLVHLEVLCKPLQDEQGELVTLYRQFLATLRTLSIDNHTFDLALSLRVRHRLKTPDAIHLAVAKQHQCDFLWTNDNRLSAAAGAMTINLLSEATE